MESKKTSLKKKFKNLRGKNIFKILYVVFLLAGVTTGVILVQQEQDISERAEIVGCSPISTKKCTSKNIGDICDGGVCRGKVIGGVQTNLCFCSGSETFPTCSLPNVCQKYNCSSGYTPTIGTCTIVDSVCCKPATTTACTSPNVCQRDQCSSGYTQITGTCTNAGWVCCRPKDGTTCQNNYTGKCVPDNSFCDKQNLGRVDCPTGQVCVRETTTCISPVPCPTNTSCNVPSSTKGAVYCYQSNKLDTKFCCPTSKPKYDSATKSCVASSTGGGGGGGGTPTNPPGGGTNPTTPPGGGSACNISYHENPSTFAGFSKSGKLALYINPGGYQFNIALKKNADTCSQSDYDVLLDTKNVVDSKLETGMDVAMGDKVCVYAVGYEGTPGGGWIEPEGGVCQGPNGAPKDISDLLHKAPEAVSVQCWGDVEIEDCDFNDFVFVFAVEEGGTTESLSFKLRFQGITQKVNYQWIGFYIYQNNQAIKTWSIPTFPNDDGTYTVSITENMGLNAILPGTYDIWAKSESHLAKRYTNINIPQAKYPIDFSQTEEEQAKAGDVTGDNIISLDDIARVSKYYTSLSVPVSYPEIPKTIQEREMMAADINKDGQITIQDLALIAINWSEFSVKGDE